MKWNSIQWRLTAVAFVFIVGTSVTMAIIGSRMVATFASHRFEEHFRFLVQHTARNAELGVLLGDKEMLRRLCKNVIAQGDVYEVLIRDRHGKVLVKMRSSKPKGRAISFRAFIRAPRMSPDNLVVEESARPEIVGSVLVTYRTGHLQSLVRRTAVRYAVTAAVMILLSLLVYHFLARSIVRPLGEVVDAARQVSHGSGPFEVSGGGLLETRTLADAFNEMVRAVESRERALHEAHRKMARQEALAEVGKFSMMVAHEIKNPLAIIKGGVQILKGGGADPATTSTVLDYLLEEVERIDRLLEDFLLFSRPVRPRMHPLDLGRLAADLATKMELMAQEGQGRVLFEGGEHRCLCKGDGELLERALSHIVRNALEAGGGESVVTLRTLRKGDCCRIEIHDNGPGIPPEHQSKVFEPFFTTKAKGTGLGLAMTRRIVEGHGGRIELRSRVARGSLFIIDLPALNEEAPGTRPGDLTREESPENTREGPRHGKDSDR